MNCHRLLSHVQSSCCKNLETIALRCVVVITRHLTYNCGRILEIKEVCVSLFYTQLCVEHTTITAERVGDMQVKDAIQVFLHVRSQLGMDPSDVSTAASRKKVQQIMGMIWPNAKVPQTSHGLHQKIKK